MINAIRILFEWYYYDYIMNFLAIFIHMTLQ